MKRLISVAAVALSILSLASTARADELPGGLKVTHLGDSGARPNRVRVLSATHYFEVHVEGKPLSQLSVVLLKGVNASKDVVVTDQSGQQLNATYSVDAGEMNIDFAQPVSAGTNLLVSLKNVKSPFPRRRHMLLYPVHIRSFGIPGEIPLGLARVSLRLS